jgi:hypothetical protein
MVRKVLLDQRLDPRIVDVSKLVLGVLDGSAVLAPDERSYGD